MGLALRLGIALAAFAVAWIVISVVAVWLFGSANVLVWVLAALVGEAAYLLVPRRQPHGG